MKSLKFRLPISIEVVCLSLGDTLKEWEQTETCWPYYVTFQHEESPLVDVIVLNEGREISIQVENHCYDNSQLRQVLKAVRAVLSAHALAQS